MSRSAARAPRAALAEAVDEGTDPAQPGRAVGLPRTVAKPVKVKESDAWDADEVDRFLEATARPSLGDRVPPRRALRAAPQRGARAAVGRPRRRGARPCASTRARSPSSTGAAWSDAKNERSRRTIPLDDETMRASRSRRAEQATERLHAGTPWEDHDLIIATRFGRLVLPRSYDRRSRCIVSKADMPRLTSHGLRHTAATHMVAERERPRRAPRDRRHPRPQPRHADEHLRPHACRNHSLPWSTGSPSATPHRRRRARALLGSCGSRRPLDHVTTHLGSFGRPGRRIAPAVARSLRFPLNRPNDPVLSRERCHEFVRRQACRSDVRSIACATHFPSRGPPWPLGDGSCV